MSYVPRSKEFDDVYFSPKDGLAESKYVFLAGNGLPDAWVGKASFTIAETGFGTGLNFLAVLNLWLDSDVDKRPEHLHFISFEKYPLDKEDIEGALAQWGELSGELAMLLTVYPTDFKYNISVDVIEGVRLSLVFGDVNDELPKLKETIDCWFLDGFKPSSNPDMWSDVVFSNMARLSIKGASFATFTAAGFVRRGLEGVGFNVQKVKGFRYKRDMCIGCFSKL